MMVQAVSDAEHGRFETRVRIVAEDLKRTDPPPAGTRIVSTVRTGALLLLALPLLGCGASERDALAQARQRGMIRIGYAVEEPYALLTPDGKVTGEAPEIARIIAARLGIPRVEWRLTDFDRLIEGLEARRYDVIAAGLFITPERQQRVAFSRPTFQVGPGLLVREGNPLALHSYSDLRRLTRVRIAVLGGSVEEARLLQLGFPEDHLLRVPDALSGRTAVRSGQADGLALSAPTIRWIVQRPVTGVCEMAAPFTDQRDGAAVPPAQGGFAFRPGDVELLRAWNAELARFLGSAEHRRLASAFGFTAAELPPAAVTRKEPAHER